MAEMPWFPLYAADFAMDTATWSDQEVGAYLRLLLSQWANGSIPEDANRRGRLVSSGADGLAAMWPTIGAKFASAGAGRLVNPRMERERQAGVEQRKKYVERARKGAAARWQEGQEVLEASDKHMPEECLEQCYEQCLDDAHHSHSHIQKSQSPPQPQTQKGSPNGELSGTPSGSRPGSPIKQVWKHYLERRAEHYAGNGSTGRAPVLTSTRSELIKRRLKDGYEPDHLCAAIDGMFKTPHNLGKNDRATKYLDLEIALRVNKDGNNVERFAETAVGLRKASGAIPGARESSESATAAGFRAWVRAHPERMEERGVSDLFSALENCPMADDEIRDRFRAATGEELSDA